MPQTNDKQIYYFTIFLMKESAENFDNCLKSIDALSQIPVKSSFGFEGTIYCADKRTSIPKWKLQLDELSAIPVPVDENASNKAVMLVKIHGRILSIIFGYGRSLIREECIERNFGLRVALNLIDPMKLRSINAATIEDLVVMTQRQASQNTVQEEFGLNIFNDIMKGVTGQPNDESIAKTISGKDALVVSIFMNICEIKEKLETFLDALEKEDYKEQGFEWVDNVGEVRDVVIKEGLDSILVDAILRKDMSYLHVSPSEIIDWERTQGFCFGGMRKRIKDPANYKVNIDLEGYMNYIHPGIMVLQKLHRDKLWAINVDNDIYSTGNVYESLVFQTHSEGETYILANGSWYAINKSFFDRIYNFVKHQIPCDRIILPDCEQNMNEGEYNRRVCAQNADFCLMDRKFVAIEGAPKQIEGCDIFTKSKQFIHVKNKGKSSQLSHWFAQGRISAQCFISDQQYREQINSKLIERFGESCFNPIEKPNTSDFEIVFALIDSKYGDVCDTLPFFSLLNLMLNVIELERMHYKYSVVKIKRTL